LTWPSTPSTFSASSTPLAPNATLLPSPEMMPRMMSLPATGAPAAPVPRLVMHTAKSLYEDALALHRELGNRKDQIFPLMNLGGLYYEMGRPREALAYYEESLALSHEVGETDWARALTWNNVGESYLMLEEPTRAIDVTEPNYQLFSREHDVYGAATCAFTLGRAYWRAGDGETGRQYLDEAERMFRNLGNPAMAARILYFRATFALEANDVAAARRDLAAQGRNATTGGAR